MFWFRHEQVQWLSPQMPQIRLVMKWASRGSLPFMKMLYPRKIEEVLYASATTFCLKSILVYRPRLPTMRVIGSHDISVRSVLDEPRPDEPGRASVVVIGSAPLRCRPIAGVEFRSAPAPLRFLVQRVLGEH